MKMQRIGKDRYNVNGHNVLQIDDVFVVEETEQELSLLELDSLPYKNPWAAPVQDLRKVAPKVAPVKKVGFDRSFLLRQSNIFEVNRLQEAFKTVEKLTVKKGDQFCFSCGRVNPAPHPSGGTACCEDDTSQDKQEVLDNFKQTIEDLTA